MTAIPLSSTTLRGHATESQFRRAYPRFGEFVALKQRLDPTNKFRNSLWDTYYPR
jgi:hypothetical protein